MSMLHNDTEFDAYSSAEYSARRGIASNDPHADPRGHAAMLEALADRPEACIRWLAVACCIVGAILLARGMWL